MTRTALRLALAAAAALVAGAVSSGDASAQVLYKWTDKDGKIHYSDTPPRAFVGTVTTLEPDAKPDPAPPTTRKTEMQARDMPAQEPDLAAKRRAVREALAANVLKARDKLEAAKAALSERNTPEDNERQVVQQRLERNNPRPSPTSASTGGMYGTGGMHGGAPRSNCQTVTGSDRRTVTTCPTAVPTEAYYERIQKLEEAVRQAESELDAAESAYRRGVD